LGDANEEGWDVDHLLANSDVSLGDEDASVMDGGGELSLLDQSLKSSLKELGGGQTENVIELALVILQKSKSNHSSDEGLTFEDSSWVGCVHGQKNTGGLSELGEDELGSPHFSLASEAVGSDETKFVDNLLSLEGSSRSLRCFRVVGVFYWHLEGLIFGV